MTFYVNYDSVIKKCEQLVVLYIPLVRIAFVKRLSRCSLNIRITNMNIKKYLAILSVALFTIVFFGLAPNFASASCDGANMSLFDYQYFLSRGWIGGEITISGLTASAHIFNETACILPASLASFKMYDQTRASQVLFARTAVSYVAPHSSLNLSVALPNCMSQIDAYYGSAPSTPVGDDSINFAATFNMNTGGSIGRAAGNFCVNIPPPPPGTITASCSAAPSSIIAGGSITWGATASGGTGNYTYSWSGTDSLSGTLRTTSMSYPLVGTKNASVTVTDGTNTAVANCTATVNPPGSIIASCSASPSSVNAGGTITWSAAASGGTGNLSYSWSGTDSLSGASSTTAMAYPLAGTKDAAVTVTDGTHTTVANCSAVVNTPGTNNDNSLRLTCSGTPLSGNIGDLITWRAAASRGDGGYTYSWSGTDGLTGTTETIPINYTTIGGKTANVTVHSGSYVATASCSVSINSSGGSGGIITNSTVSGGGVTGYVAPVVLAYSHTNPLLASVYLSQVPYTGPNDGKIFLFTIALALWSGVVTFIIIKRRDRQNQVLAIDTPEKFENPDNND